MLGDGLPKRMQTRLQWCIKAKINVMAKPHPYNFFTLQLDSMHENWICVHLCSYQSCEWVFEFYTLSTMTSLQPTQAQCADNWTWVGCNWLLKFKRGHLKFLVSGRSKQASKRTLAYAQWSHASVGLAQAHPNKSLSNIWTSCISTVTLVVEHVEVACLLLSTLTIGGFLPWHGLCALFKYLCLYNWQSKVAYFLMP